MELDKDNGKELAFKYEDEFEYQIIKRGIDYYKKKNVLDVYKNGNTYYSHVMSDNGVDEYLVTISECDDELDMDCSCPYNYPCKHEYATLLAIDNKDIKDIELLPDIEYIDYDLYNIILKIPADELKEFIVERVKKTRFVFNDIELFNNRFYNYLPIQKKEYYYNKLFNMLSMKINVHNLVDEYMSAIKQYIDHNNYSQAFIIIRALIDAYYRVEKHSSLEFIEEGLIVKLAMYLRIIYRKISEYERIIINEWVIELKEKEFYDDVYLEDMILTIK